MRQIHEGQGKSPVGERFGERLCAHPCCFAGGHKTDSEHITGPERLVVRVGNEDAERKEFVDDSTSDAGVFGELILRQAQGHEEAWYES